MRSGFLTTSLFFLPVACATVPRTTVPLAGTTCAPLVVESSVLLSSGSPERPKAVLTFDAQGQPYVFWIERQGTLGNMRNRYAQATEREGRWTIERNVLPAVASEGHFLAARTRGSLVVWGSRDSRSYLFSGPPWRSVPPSPSWLVAADAAGRLHSIAHVWNESLRGPSTAELMRLEGDKWLPVAKAELPELSQAPTFERTDDGIALLFYPKPAPSPQAATASGRPIRVTEEVSSGYVRQQIESGFHFSLADRDKAPNAQPLNAAQIDFIHSKFDNSSDMVRLRYPSLDASAREPGLLLAHRHDPQDTAGCDPNDQPASKSSSSERTCRTRSATIRFPTTNHVIYRPGEAVVVGIEWTERSPAYWHSQICGNDRAPIGWYRRYLQKGSGQLLIAKIPDGKPPCLQTLALEFGNKPSPSEQGAIDAEVDPAGRIHLLTWTHRQLRYLRLR